VGEDVRDRPVPQVPPAARPRRHLDDARVRRRRGGVRGAALVAAPDDGLATTDLAAVLARAVPGADPTDARAIGEGWGATAYRLGTRTVRLLKPNAYTWGIDAGYAREPALLALLAAHGIPAPSNAEAICDDDGRVLAITYDYIEGDTIGALGRDAVGTLAREVGAALTALHATPIEEARAIGVPELDLGEELYRPMVEACLPHLGPRGRAWLERRFAAFVDGGGSRDAPRVLVHGDLGGSHVLADDASRLAGIIDWGDALIADPAYDLAALLANCPRSFHEHVIEAYEGPASRDADAGRRVAFYVDALPIWQVYFGGDIDGGAERRVGVRRIAARAAAAARAS
jgi:aminoglycoside phosphotransferase (APT) family kinase protein